MFKHLFKNILLNMNKAMATNDAPFIAMQKENHDVTINTYKYANDDNPMHYLNIYLPKEIDTNKKYPFIIDVHGGGWVYGDKDLNGLFAMDFVKRGYIVMTMSYRLLINDYKLVDMIHDIDNSIRFTLNLNDLPIDKDKIALAGDSAGGHLAYLLLSIYNSPFLRSLFDIKPINLKINSLILNHPAIFIHDVHYSKEKPIINKIAEHYYNIFYFGKCNKKDPLYIYSDGENFIKFSNKQIPILLISSKLDNVVQDQAFKLKNILEKDNIPHEFYFDDSSESYHVFNVTRPFLKESNKCNSYIDEFIKKHNA